MLSGIVTISSTSVPAPFPAEVLLRGLAALVPAAVDGVLGDLCLAAPGGIAGLPDIAAQAGCRLAEENDCASAIAAAISRARYDTILVLAMGRAPAAGFHREIDERMRAGVQKLLMRDEPDGFLQRLFPPLAPVALVAGPRQSLRCPQAKPGRELAALARNLGPASTLNAKAIIIRADAAQH